MKIFTTPSQSIKNPTRNYNFGVNYWEGLEIRIERTHAHDTHANCSLIRLSASLATSHPICPKRFESRSLIGEQRRSPPTRSILQTATQAETNGREARFQEQECRSRTAYDTAAISRRGACQHSGPSYRDLTCHRCLYAPPLAARMGCKLKIEWHKRNYA
jgi:hypothetical protein